jgi:hypothetical protein
VKPLIFISYLRKTGAGWAQAIFGELTNHFSSSEIFFDRDADDVPLGSDYWVPITSALESCQVVLAIIDKQWFPTMSDLTRKSRIGILPRKPVLPTMCQELVTAFSLPRAVFPLVFESDRLPDISRLPRELAPLSRYPIVEIYPFNWEAAVARLVHKIVADVREAARLEQQVVEQIASPWIGDVVGGVMSPGERAMLGRMEPKDRARYLLQMKMQEKAELAALVVNLQALRNQNSMKIISNVR